MFSIIRRIYKIYWQALSMLATLYFKAIGISINDNLSIRGFPHIISRRRGMIRIGSNCTIFSSTVSNPVGLNHKSIIRTLLPEARITIGNNTGISGSTVLARKDISIGCNVNIGGNCFITDSDHHQLNPNLRKIKSDKNIQSYAVVIEDNVWLGLNVIVLKGVKVGSNSVIGAGSVVISDIPKNVVACGNPAKVIKKLY